MALGLLSTYKQSKTVFGLFLETGVWVWRRGQEKNSKQNYPAGESVWRNRQCGARFLPRAYLPNAASTATSAWFSLQSRWRPGVARAHPPRPGRGTWRSLDAVGSTLISRLIGMYGTVAAVAASWVSGMRWRQASWCFASLLQFGIVTAA